MKRILWLFLLGGLLQGVYAQQGLIQILPSNPFDQAGLAEVQIVNGGAETIKVLFALDMRPGNQRKLSRPVELQPGLNRLPLGDLQAWVRQFAQAGENGDPGELCLEVLSFPERQRLAVECFQRLSMPAQPPHLVYPFDREVLQTYLPVFSWTPPMPVRASEVITYQLKVCEVAPYQSPQMAIQQNLPVLQKEGIRENIFPSSLSDRPFKQKQRYTWQIFAFSGGHFIGQSEVWSFTIDEPKPAEEEATRVNYVRLERTYGSGFYPARGKVCFRFDCQYGEQKPTFAIKDSRGNQVKISKNKLERTGDNLFILSLPPGSGLMEGSYYYLDVTNAKGEKRSLRFRYLYPDL